MLMKRHKLLTVASVHCSVYNINSSVKLSVSPCIKIKKIATPPES